MQRVARSAPASTLERLLATHGGAVVWALAALVLLAGFGMRDPWPADEPRFAVIARDMLASGHWLIPTIGGALYADKPPLHFWLVATSIELFGSVRAGKRGVYVLPALPALALAAAPHLSALLTRCRLQALAWAVLFAIALAATAATLYYGASERALPTELAGYTGSVATMIAPFALLAGACAAASGPKRGLIGLCVFLIGLWLVVGWVVWPQLDPVRSGKRIMDSAYASLPAGAELGVVAQKETLLLHARGPLTNFGHRRTDALQEQADAALWLGGSPNRYLLLRREHLEPCCGKAPAVGRGLAHGIEWQRVPHSAANPDCAARGIAAAAIH